MASPIASRPPGARTSAAGITLKPRHAAARLRRHSGRRLWRTLAWAATAFIAAAAAGRILQRPFASPARSGQATARQLRLLLEPTEKIEKESYAYQRHWWDLFNETRGTLAVTDRRLIFVGLPPRDLLLRDEGPPAFDVRAFPYDTMTFMSPRRVFLWSENGAQVRTRQGREVYATRPEDAGGVRAIAAIIDRYRTNAIESAYRDRWLASFPTPPAPPPLVHIVRPGQALASIARVYGGTPEDIMRLNALPADRIQINQRLIVPRPDTLAVDFTADVEVAGPGMRSVTPSTPTSASSSEQAATVSERPDNPTSIRAPVRRTPAARPQP